jgi:hypothetical protein
MQEEKARQAKLVRSAAECLLSDLTRAEKAAIRDRARAGLAAIERGEYTDYVGRGGLAKLAAGVKSRGRKLLADRAPTE